MAHIFYLIFVVGARTNGLCIPSGSAWAVHVSKFCLVREQPLDDTLNMRRVWIQSKPLFFGVSPQPAEKLGRVDFFGTHNPTASRSLFSSKPMMIFPSTSITGTALCPLFLIISIAAPRFSWTSIYSNFIPCFFKNSFAIVQ